MKYPPKTIFGVPDEHWRSGEEQGWWHTEDTDQLPDGPAAVYEFKGFVIVHREINVADATPEEVDRLLNTPQGPKMELPF
jgi:hypothetical protein